MEFVSVEIHEPTTSPQAQPGSNQSGSLTETRGLASSQTITQPQRWHRAESWRSLVSSSSTFLFKVTDTFTTRTSDTYRLARTQFSKRGGIVVKAAGIVGLVVACVTLWPTFSAMQDTRRALLLAEWTARKEFLEFCEAVGTSVSASTSACF
jgi:hypothetical protein